MCRLNASFYSYKIKFAAKLSEISTCFKKSMFKQKSDTVCEVNP